MITTISVILSLISLNPSTGAILRKKSAAKYGHEEGINGLQRLHELVDLYHHDDSSAPHHLESTLENLVSTSKHNKKSHVSGRYSHFEDTDTLNDDDFIYSVVKSQAGEIQLAKFNDEFQDYRDNIVLLKGVEVDNAQKLKEIISILLSNTADRKFYNNKELALKRSQRNLEKKIRGVYGPPILRGNSDVTLNEMITNFETLKAQAVNLFKKNVVGNGNVNDILKFLPKQEKATVKQIHDTYHNKKHSSKASLTAQEVEKHVRDILYGGTGENIIKPSSDNQNIILVPQALYNYILTAGELVHG